MRKYILYICILLLVISLISCNKTGDTDITPDGDVTLPDTSSVTGEKDPLSLVPTSEIWDVYAVSKNVFSGRIIGIESKESDNSRLDYYVTISVDAVYKGDYNVGDVVLEEFTSDVYFYNQNLHWNSRYFMMTGIDEDVSNIKDAKSIIKYSGCSAIQLESNGLYYVPKLSEYLQYFRNGSFDDLLYNFMLNFEGQVLDCLKEDFPEITIKEYCELADNIYYGEVLESTEIGMYGYTGKPIYKNKIRVMNVYKGNYKPGEIVEDISLKNCGVAPTLKGEFPLNWNRMRKPDDYNNTNYAFFITGEYYNNLFTSGKSITNE